MHGFALAEDVARFGVGDPSDPDTYVGPLVSARQHDRVQGYLQAGVDEGATVATGGPGPVEGLAGGHYVRPTVFRDVDNSMRIAREEIFGPVLSILPYDTEDDFTCSLKFPTGVASAHLSWNAGVRKVLDAEAGEVVAEQAA